MTFQLRSLFARLLRDCSGTSIIETAVVLPTLMMLMAGATDLAMGVWTKMQTQQAAARRRPRRTIELATSGGLENLSESVLQSDAAAAANIAANKVTVTKWLECNGVKQVTFDMGCNSGEIVGRYVSVRVTNSYRPILGAFLPATVAPGGMISFTGYSSLRLQ